MKITGQILKEARERKGISIAEVSLATKINSKILTAIEQGNLSKLPPKTFLRGFVLSYASFLQLDVDQVIKTFQDEMGTTRPPVETPDKSLTTSPASERATERLKGTNSNSSFAKVGAVVGIIVLVLVIIFLKKKMDSYESESVIKPAENAIASATPLTESSPTPTSDLSGGSDLSAAANESAASAESTLGLSGSSAVATAAPAATSTPAPKSTPAPRSTPIAKPSPTSTPTPAPAVKPSPAPSPTLPPKASPSPTPKPATGRVQDVTIEALNGVDVEATIDGETQSFHLNADQVQTLKAKRKVSLKLSDGGAVSIIVNGIDRGVPGDLGKPKKVDIP